MSKPQNTTPANIHRDISFTVLAGPLKFIVPLISYAFLYPLLLSRFGPELLGLWSLLYSIVALIGAGDIGFSQILTREAGQGRTESELKNSYKDYVATNRSYHLITALLVLLFLVFKEYFAAKVEGLYASSGFTLAVVLVITGSMIQLGGKLDAAILAARQDNFFVQLTWSLAPVFVFIPSVIGVFFQKPLEGLGLGICLSGLLVRCICGRRLRHRHPVWSSCSCSCSPRDSWRRTIDLCRRGGHFYMLSLGMMLRGPIVRFIIASSIGLAAVAVFEIGLRLTQTMRDCIANGFGVLYPSFGYFFRKGDTAQIIETSRLSIMTLVPLGTLALSMIICFAELIFTWWLPEIPAQLVRATLILSAWQLITLFNVPFWYILQAAGLEKIASWSVWIHTLCICALFPLATLFKLDIVDFCLYWTLSSLATQVMIYYTIEKRLSLFFAILKDPGTRIVIGSSLLFYLSALVIISIAADNTLQRVQYLVPCLLVFVLINVKTSLRPLSAFFMRSRERGKLV